MLTDTNNLHDARKYNLIIEMLTITALLFSISMLASCKNDELPPLPEQNGKVLYGFLLKIGRASCRERV